MAFAFDILRYFMKRGFSDSMERITITYGEPSDLSKPRFKAMSFRSVVFVAEEEETAEALFCHIRSAVEVERKKAVAHDKEIIFIKYSKNNNEEATWQSLLTKFTEKIRYTDILIIDDSESGL
eukprot:GHVU01201303.1.p1 GENE.GHVU01201303.1~~GHVU01201303.1.p1  ORF type:complete len:123 (-),score=18.61 GHVU01201303.1:1687-2055(-)